MPASKNKLLICYFARSAPLLHGHLILLILLADVARLELIPAWASPVSSRRALVETGLGADGVQVLGSNLADLGWGRTLPYLAMFVASNGGGWLGDHLIQSHRFSVASARKTVNSIGVQIFLHDLANSLSRANQCLAHASAALIATKAWRGIMRNV